MIIDAQKITDILLDETRDLIKKRESKAPHLAMVYVDYDPNSKKYLQLKQKAAARVGMTSKLYEFPSDITTRQLRKEITRLAKMKKNDALLIELPFPKHINTQYALNAMPSKKDPDVLSEKAQGAFFVGRSPVLPPNLDAVRAICEYYDVDLQGKECVVFGFGILVGRPIANWLSSKGATVTIVNEFTPNQKVFSKRADIIVSGAPEPHIITGDMVKEGVIIMDWGYVRLNGKLVGNVVFDEVEPKASLITSVPGGVGPIGIASALRNVLILLSS